jgi:hypothetical protein
VPTHFFAPSEQPIDYEGRGAQLAIRVRELFGSPRIRSLRGLPVDRAAVAAPSGSGARPAGFGGS